MPGASQSLTKGRAAAGLVGQEQSMLAVPEQSHVETRWPRGATPLREDLKPGYDNIQT